MPQHWTTAALTALATSLSPGLFNPRNVGPEMDTARAANIDRLAKALIAQGNTVEGYEE